jgi:hypothetical protein
MSEEPHDESPEAAHVTRRGARSRDPEEQHPPLMREPGAPDTPEQPASGAQEAPPPPTLAPSDETHPEPQALAGEAPVEALLGLRDFLAIAPRRRSPGTTVASTAALQRWMHLRGYDVHGFYTAAQWQTFYAETMRYTGGGVIGRAT